MDVDLEKFFDRVNHDILMERLARRIADKRVLELIRLYLQAGILANGVSIERHGGNAARRASHAIDAKDNFEFERRVALCRTLSILDLRRKR